MSRPVTILASGTTGDIRPFVALGRGLRAAGCPVTIATHARFAALVHAHGLPFRPVDGNPSDLLLHDDAALTFDAGIIRGGAATVRFIRVARPLYERMLTSAAEACRGSAAIIISLASCWGQHIATAFRIPCIWAPLQPITPTGRFSSPLLPGISLPGARLRRLSYAAVELALWAPWRASVARWRLRVTGSRAGSPNPFTLARQERAPVIYGFSQHVVPPPDDWPMHHVTAGYWFLDDDAGFQLAPAIEAFLAAGEPPVYIGFGSMGGRRPAGDAALALGALVESGRRGILLGGPDVAQLAARRADVLVISSAPHHLLFPRVSAVVHHGGAGTTAAGLRAGVPTVTLPVGVDQYFWGARLAALGAGAPPLARRYATPERLAAAIGATESETMISRASALGRLIRAEDGVARAVTAISGSLD
ncbi:MAG: glycosyltransferase family 1 protein [Chloroflexi bacterium]|nr:glycosyltransferase family 1 protein [Chloroflexota bacterium]